MGLINPFPQSRFKPDLEVTTESWKTESNTWKSEVRVFPQECLIISQGIGPDAAIIAEEIAETALLAYKIQRRKLFYWEFRERLVAQVITITARKLMRLPIDTLTRQGSLTLLALSSRTWWFGAVGEGVLFVIRNNEMQVERIPRPESFGQLFGQTKHITPIIKSGESRVGDWYCLQTTEVIPESDLAGLITTATGGNRFTSVFTRLKEILKHKSAQNTAFVVAYKSLAAA